MGTDVYEKLVKGYTEKQWGRPCTELPAFIIRRLPVRFTFDNNYFNARYQGIPIGGYTAMVEHMLSGIEIRLGADYLEDKATWDAMADTVVGYETCVNTAAQVDLERGRVKYAFIPVWLLSTRWNDQNFLFAMNGQTGKLIGDLPMDKKKFWTTFGIIAGAITAVLSAFFYL